MPAYLNDGSPSLAAANWDDSNGFAANADLIIENQKQAITDDLDQSTNAIDYLHILGGSPRIEGASNEAMKIKINTGYTTKPNFLWRAAGGLCRVDFETNSAPEVVAAGGGQLILFDGSCDRLIVHSGEVVITSTFVVATEIVVNGGSLTIYDHASDSVPSLSVNGGGVLSYRRVAAKIVNGGDFREENTSGTTGDSLNINGGRYFPIAGSTDNVTRKGGNVVLNSAVRELTLGSAGVTNYGPGSFPTSAGNVTISNVKDYAEFYNGGQAQGGGAGTPL